MAILPIVFIAAAVWADRWVKGWAAATLKGAPSVPGIEGVFQLTYAENRGAAFSILQDKRWFLITAATLSIGAMLYILISGKIRHPVGRWGLYFIIAGAFGNLMDRVLYGYVVDMIELIFIRFAIFNVADCFVSVGTALFAFYLLFFYGEKTKQNAEPYIPDEETDLQ